MLKPKSARPVKTTSSSTTMDASVIMEPSSISPPALGNVTPATNTVKDVNLLPTIAVWNVMKVKTEFSNLIKPARNALSLDVNSARPWRPARTVMNTTNTSKIQTTPTFASSVLLRPVATNVKPWPLAFPATKTSAISWIPKLKFAPTVHSAAKNVTLQRPNVHNVKQEKDLYWTRKPTNVNVKTQPISTKLPTLLTGNVSPVTLPVSGVVDLPKGNVPNVTHLPIWFWLSKMGKANA